MILPVGRQSKPSIGLSLTKSNEMLAIIKKGEPMPKSRVIAILSLFVLSVILSACGSDDDAAEATAEPTATRSPALATETEVVVAETSSPEVRPALATPMDLASVGTPAAMQATPHLDAVTVATPVADATPVAATDAAATPVDSSTLATMQVQATFTLGGVEQQDYLVSAEGCVGLRDWRGMQAGAQVIVRDANGTVVDVSELEAIDSADSCSWVADLSVPDSEFVSISVPMIAEVWFSQSELETGEVEITLP